MKEEIIRKGIIKGLKHNFSTGSFPIPCTNKDIEDFINNGLQNPDAKSTYESLKVTGEFIYKKAKEEERKKLLNSQKRNKELKRQIVNMQDE